MVAIIRTYQGYAVTGTERPNPAAVYADPSSTLSLLKNAMNIVVAIISDAIIVSHWSCLAYDPDMNSSHAGVPDIHCVEHELLRRSCTARAFVGRHRCVIHCSRSANMQAEGPLHRNSRRHLGRLDSGSDWTWNHSHSRRRLRPHSLLLYHHVRSQHPMLW